MLSSGVNRNWTVVAVPALFSASESTLVGAQAAPAVMLPALTLSFTAGRAEHDVDPELGRCGALVSGQQPERRRVGGDAARRQSPEPPAGSESAFVLGGR